MTTCTISINDDLLEAINKRIKKRKFSSKSEYFRYLARVDIFSEDDVSRMNKDHQTEKEIEKATTDIDEAVSRLSPDDFPTLKEVLQQS